MNEENTIKSKQPSSVAQDRSASERALEQVAAFYNEYAEQFLEFEEQTGVNVWFLKYFRVYFSYRDFLAAQSSSKEKQSEKKQVAKGGNSILKTLIRALSELLYVLSSFGKVDKPSSSTLLLASTKEIREGAFGELHNTFEQVQNREVFNLKKPFSRNTADAGCALSSDRILGNYLLSLSAIKELIGFRQKLKTFQIQLHAEIPDSNTIDSRIAHMVFSNLSSLIIYYARFRAFCKFFENFQPQGILMTDENSPQQKVIQYAARKNGVKVFAYQHGNIHRWNPAYNYSLFEKKPSLPDITFVWGEHSRKMLASWGGYSTSAITISGRITPLNATRNRNPKIETDKKLIVYASQPQHDANMRARHLKDVLGAVQSHRHTCQLVVRPHPAETDNAYFTSAAESVGYTELIIDRESDLVTHMETCDVLITAFSTVGTEFIPFYKPLIVLDYMDEDLMGWIADGVGIRAKNEEDVAQVIGAEPNISREKYEAFIQHHFFTLDGKATSRIFDSIDKHN